MPLSEFKKRYDRIEIPPRMIGDITWLDRLRTWEAFVQRGPRVAWVLRGQDAPIPIPNEEDRVICSEMYDLVLEAFPVGCAAIEKDLATDR